MFYTVLNVCQPVTEIEYPAYNRLLSTGVAYYNLHSAEHGVELPQAILSAALTNWSAILDMRSPELVLQQFGNNVSK